MKHVILLALIIILTCAEINAQGEDHPPHAQTTSPPTARFEVVQSHLTAKWTFLLDKYTGNVFQLVKTKDDEMSWEKMKVYDLPAPKADLKVRYQIFTSGLAARHTFLLNIETGDTWLLVTGKDSKGIEYHAWQPFE